MNLVGIVTRKSSILYLAHVKIKVLEPQSEKVISNNNDNNINNLDNGGANIYNHNSINSELITESSNQSYNLNNQIELTTTDTEISIIEKVPIINIIRAGELTVDALKLYEIIRKLPNNKEISIKSDEHYNLTITCNNIEFSLPFLDSEHFPTISEENQQYSLDLNKEEIRLLLDKIKFAIYSENARLNIKGIFIKADVQNNILISAATDCHRLATASLKKQIALNFSFILPKKTVYEVIKVFASQEKASLSLHGEQNITRVRFSSNNLIIISKLIAGTFPDFQNVLPKNFLYCLQVHCRELIAAVERVAIVSSEQSKSIKLDLKESKIYLSASNADSSFAREIIETPHNIENFETHINYSYFLDILTAIDDENVEISLNNSNSPIMIKDPKHSELTYIIMPMSI